MEKASDRQKKRDSAKKHRDLSVYTKKAVRIHEAQLEKNKPCSGQEAFKRV
jgi:hypothetical protein